MIAIGMVLGFAVGIAVAAIVSHAGIERSLDA